MAGFKKFLIEQEAGKDWFSGATYRIDGKTYSVKQLAGWAKENLVPVNLAMAQIQNKYINANDLFVDAEGEWTQRSMKTDLSYPILVLELDDGRFDIIDGNHRVWKAWKNGVKAVKAYLIKKKDLAFESAY